MNAKNLSISAAALAILGVGAITGARTYQKPKTVIQVVAIRWTADAAPEQRRAALDGMDKLAAEFPGVRNVWLRPLHLQPRDFMSAYAIEFDDQAAAERFAKLPAHETWNKSFLPLIEESRTQQLTN
jgi:hypothetical protein